MTWLVVLVVGGCAAQVSEQRYDPVIASLERDLSAAEAERAGDHVYVQCRTGYPPPGVPDPAGWLGNCPEIIRAWDARVERAQARLERAQDRAESRRETASSAPVWRMDSATAALLAPTPRSAPPAPAPQPPAPMKLECRPNAYGGGSTCTERQPFTLPPIVVPQ
jgi:hypothetical protein